MYEYGNMYLVSIKSERECLSCEHDVYMTIFSISLFLVVQFRKVVRRDRETSNR